MRVKGVVVDVGTTGDGFISCVGACRKVGVEKIVSVW